MMRIISFGVAFCLLSAAAARAQSWEVSALAGYVPAAELEQRSLSIDSASIGDAAMFSIHGARFWSNWGIEASFTQEFSSYDVTLDGETGSLFSVGIAQVHGDVVYEFRGEGSRLRPFVLAGLGATFFGATDVSTEIKVSAGAGGGARLFLSEHVAIRAQFRYRPVWLNGSEDGTFCDPFTFCQSSLHRFDVAAGVSLRF